MGALSVQSTRKRIVIQATDLDEVVLGTRELFQPAELLLKRLKRNHG